MRRTGTTLVLSGLALAVSACAVAHPHASGLVEIAPTPPVLVRFDPTEPDARYVAAARRLCAGASTGRVMAGELVDRHDDGSIVIMGGDDVVVSCVIGHDDTDRFSVIAQTVVEGARKGTLTIDGVEAFDGHVRLFGEVPDGVTSVRLTTGAETIEATVRGGYYALSGVLTAMPTSLEGRDDEGHLVAWIDRAGMALLTSAFGRP